MSNRSPLCIGIDVGTSSLKAVAVDAHAVVVASAVVEYPFDTPQPGWAQTDPEVWWIATCAALKQLLGDARVEGAPIVSIGLSGQMHGLVLVDGNSAATGPALMWNDQRTDAVCARAEREITAERIWQFTGNRLLPGFTAPKLLWLRDHAPERLRNARRLMLPKDYVRLRLTGAVHTDVSDASGTLLFDCANRCWSQPMCEALAINADLLPEVFESITMSSRVHERGAAATGLPLGTPVAAGAGDQAAQAVGTGIVHEGCVACTIGTSGVIFATTNVWRPTPNGSLHAFCHAVPNRWHLMGVTLCAGGSLRWWRDTMCGDLIARARTEGGDPYDLMLAEAAAAPAGCEGVTFLPYLSGERTPHADPFARGVFLGISARTTRGTLTRAIIEGVTCSLAQVMTLVGESGVPIKNMRLSGGGSTSPFWRQLLTNALGVPTVTVTQPHGAAYGAALLAGVGTRTWPSVDAATSTITESNHCYPNDASGDLAAIAARYADAYESLAPWFRRAISRSI
ncbi:MAG: xylulokinase [Phycisphaerales bacterium]|nr:xylulokinase [Phycisphaerales bacterium]